MKYKFQRQKWGANLQLSECETRISTVMWIWDEPLNPSFKVFKVSFLENLIVIQLSFMLIYSIKHFNNNLSCKTEIKRTEKAKKCI